jgi:hypothetical protein
MFLNDFTQYLGSRTASPGGSEKSLARGILTGECLLYERLLRCAISNGLPLGFTATPTGGCADAGAEDDANEY